MEFSELLLNNRLFENIGKDRLEAALLLYDAHFTQYKKGDLLHAAGEPMLYFGVVLSGCVQALSDDIEGNRMIMANVTAGNSFGEALCYLKLPEPSVYIMASADTSVVWLSAERLYGAGNDPLVDTLKRNFTALISIRTLQMNKRIQILSKFTIRDKILTFLSTMYGSDSDMVRIPMNREDMAAYIGTNRAALSRELSRMKAEGIIDYHKNEFIILK